MKLIRRKTFDSDCEELFMANLNSIEKMELEKLLEMESGYVLDFKNRSFHDFIFTSSGFDIYSSKYDNASGSKANRLRAFWGKEIDRVVGKLLNELLEYWKTKKLINGQEIEKNEQTLYNECVKIVNRLLGRKQEQTNYLVSEDEFLNREFRHISLEKLCCDSVIKPVLDQRLDEIKRCLNAKSPLATIFLCGSTLEGILLSIALIKPKEFNQSSVSPKKDGKVLQFHEWTLNNFIDVAHSLGLLKEDVKKFSHGLRDFRNYIHPYQQLASKFNPDEHTAKICWQVLRAAIYQLSMSSNLLCSPSSDQT